MLGSEGMRGVAVKSLKRGFKVGLMGACSWPAKEAGVSAGFLGLLLLPDGGRAGDDVDRLGLCCCKLEGWLELDAFEVAAGSGVSPFAASANCRALCKYMFMSLS